MWLYVPTSCQSAPGPEDSISASDSPAQILARSVTWNGRHSRSQTWSQRFKRVSWTMLLFGAILPPSTATRGVERWIGLLAASRASRIALPVSDKGPTTNGTCGPTPPESSAKSDPASSFWRTFQESQGITTSASGQSYEEWVTQLRKDYSRRLKSAHRIFGNDSLSWATPTAQPSASQGDAEWNGACYRRPDGSKVINGVDPSNDELADADNGAGGTESGVEHQRRGLQDVGGGQPRTVADSDGLNGRIWLRAGQSRDTEPETGRSGTDIPDTQC